MARPRGQDDIDWDALASSFWDAIADELADSVASVFNAVIDYSIESARLWPLFNFDRTIALNRLIDSLTSLGSFPTRAVARYFRQLRVPKKWGSKLVRADLAAEFFLSEFAAAFSDTGSLLRGAALLTKPATLKYGSLRKKIETRIGMMQLAPIERLILKMSKLTLARLINIVANAFQIVWSSSVGIISLIAGFFLLSALGRYRAQFLSQKAPRKTFVIIEGRKRGTIRRRAPGGAPP